MSKSIVVLGAGVIGLSVAYTLSSNDASEKLDITVVARDMPDDFDCQDWASPWAGANWSPISEFDERKYRWEKITFEKLWDMIPTSLVMAAPARIYYKNADSLPDFWWKDIVRDYQLIPEEDLPAGYNLGVSFKTVTLRPALYLKWLRSVLESRGVKFIKRRISSIQEAAALDSGTSIVVNATGLGSKGLLGVEDSNVYPIRGQAIIIHAPAVKEYVGDMSYRSDDDEGTYIIPRPDGTVILGGTYQADRWDTSVDIKTARGIMDRCSSLVPEVSPANGATIISHNVGLRPARRGGPRVEIEKFQVDLRSQSDLLPGRNGLEESQQIELLNIIHAYGFGPAGFQNSWGVADEVTSLINKL